jgi:hypothetical protein
MRIVRFLNQLAAVAGLCQLFLGRGQYTLESDDEHVLDNIGARFFWTAPHVIDFKLDEGSAFFRFDFAFGFHAEAVGCKKPAEVMAVRREMVI